MLNNVAETLLHYTIEQDFVAGREETIQLADFMFKTDRRTFGDLFNHCYKRGSQSELVKMRRPQVVGYCADLFKGLRNRIAELIEPFAALFVSSNRCVEQGAIFDNQQVLPQAVVQLHGDTFALVFLRGQQFSSKPFLLLISLTELCDAVAKCEPHHDDQRCRHHQEKPPRLIKRRKHRKSQGLTLRIPYAIAVSRDDSEGVLARWHVRKVSCAPGPRIYPIVVQSFEFVFEAQILRIDKTQRSVLNFKIFLLR